MYIIITMAADVNCHTDVESVKQYGYFPYKLATCVNTYPRWRQTSFQPASISRASPSYVNVENCQSIFITLVNTTSATPVIIDTQCYLVWTIAIPNQKLKIVRDLSLNTVQHATTSMWNIISFIRNNAIFGKKNPHLFYIHHFYYIVRMNELPFGQLIGLSCQCIINDPFQSSHLHERSENRLLTQEVWLTLHENTIKYWSI